MANKRNKKVKFLRELNYVKSSNISAQMALNPSLGPIFLPSEYSRPAHEIGTS